MKILADENVDFGIIRQLRQRGIDVISISEYFSGIKDNEVLKIASENHCLLITEDKDFGELSYRLKLVHTGILLIRLADISRKERIELVAEIIENHYATLCNNFSVLSKSGLRVKTTN